MTGGINARSLTPEPTEDPTSIFLRPKKNFYRLPGCTWATCQRSGCWLRMWAAFPADSSEAPLFDTGRRSQSSRLHNVGRWGYRQAAYFHRSRHLRKRRNLCFGSYCWANSSERTRWLLWWSALSFYSIHRNKSLLIKPGFTI